MKEHQKQNQKKLGADFNMSANPEAAAAATPSIGEDAEKFLRALKKPADLAPTEQHADHSGASLSNTHQGQAAPALQGDSSHLDAPAQTENGTQHARNEKQAAPHGEQLHSELSDDLGAVGNPTQPSHSSSSSAPSTENGGVTPTQSEATPRYPSSSSNALSPIARDAVWRPSCHAASRWRCGQREYDRYPKRWERAHRHRHRCRRPRPHRDGRHR